MAQVVRMGLHMGTGRSTAGRAPPHTLPEGLGMNALPSVACKHSLTHS